jgi:sarcosine oxidase
LAEADASPVWQHVHIVVIGAGAFGSWSTWFLAERGHRVTLIDAYGPANARASSADHSRVIRCGYGSDQIYSEWARASREDWLWLSRETGLALVEMCGALFMGAPANRYIEATYDTLSKLGIDCEAIAPGDLQQRYPQIAVHDLGRAVLEREAGVIRASAAIQSLVALMTMRRHVEYRVACAATHDETAASPVCRLTTGEILSADTFVYACGPWLPSIFPMTVGGRIRPTRQEVLHYGVPAADDRFSLWKLPVWIDFEAGVYGVPDFDGRGFKVGIDRHGPRIDPDRADRLVDEETVQRTRVWLGHRFPALADAPLVDAHVCQYENTHSGDFIIDRHPAWPNVWIVGGGSGHGFKHGPAVGRQVAALIAGDVPVNPRFALATKQTTAARAVY